MNINPIVLGDRPLMQIGHKYNFRRVLGFISTGGAVSTEPGDPYLSHLPGNYCNVSF